MIMTDDELKDGITYIQQAYRRLVEDQATDDDVNLINTIVTGLRV